MQEQKITGLTSYPLMRTFKLLIFEPWEEGEGRTGLNRHRTESTSKTEVGGMS